MTSLCQVARSTHHHLVAVSYLRLVTVVALPISQPAPTWEKFFIAETLGR
jgi:hypothetical protein